MKFVPKRSVREFAIIIGLKIEYSHRILETFLRMSTKTIKKPIGIDLFNLQFLSKFVQILFKKIHSAILRAMFSAVTFFLVKNFDHFF